MSLTTDATRINELFAEGHRLVFWFDATADRAEEIEGITINGKLLQLDGSNYLRAKVLLEHEDPQTNYLVYAPFARPEDGENPLADTTRYGATYASDRISEVMKRKELPVHTREDLEAYPLFWKNSQRMERFIQLELPQTSRHYIDMGILSVLCGSRVVHFDEVCHRVLGEGMEKAGALLDAFEAMGALEAFWQLCGAIYGYSDDQPTLDALMATMLCTYTASHGISLPLRLHPYVSEKGTNITVFLQQFMGNDRTSAAFDALSGDYVRRLNLKEVLWGKRTEELMDLDAFQLVDEIILERMTRALCEDEPQRPIAGLPMAEVASRRMQRALHYAQHYEDHYRMLLSAREVLTFAREPLEYASAQQMVSAYTQRLYQGDTGYRKFCLYYDRLQENQPYQQLSSLVERAYVNDWLDRLDKQFSERMTGEGRATLGLPLQEKFCAKYVTPRVGRERTVVIISDALRFECARELEGRLNMEARYEAQLEAMVSVLPSVTSLGMAALLPHSELSVKPESLEAYVDGKPCQNIINRQKILQEHDPHAVALSVDEVLALSSDAFSSLFNGKDVIYLYHDQIDIIGDRLTTQNEVFEACQEAMVEIENVIRRLTNEISATNFIVTADHGFQYRRSSIQEYEKIETRGTNPIYASKRYRVTREPESMAGTISFAFPYLKDGAWLSVPVGANIFKIPGGGQNYVHGGASLCEMIIPMMTVKSKKGRQETSKAQIKLLSPQRRLTNLISHLEFMQTQAISAVVKPAAYQVFFETQNGQAVSAVSLIQADIRAKETAERIFKTKVTLQNRRYDPSANYYLVIKDAGDSLAPPQRIEYTIDIAFADDFGFAARR